MDQLFRAKDQTTNLRQTQIPKAKVYSPMSLCQENGKMSVYRCVKPSIRIHARIRDQMPWVVSRVMAVEPSSC